MGKGRGTGNQEVLPLFSTGNIIRLFKQTVPFGTQVRIEWLQKGANSILLLCPPGHAKFTQNWSTECVD